MTPSPTTSSRPIARRTLPIDWYVDPAALDRERAEVLPTGWHYVGDATSVSDPGSYLTAHLGRLPLIVTRDREGVLHGMANVCRHRGAEVAQGCGSAKLLMCSYHGWSYRLDGSVNRTPGMETPEGLGLPTVRVATLGPLLFATTDESAPPLDTTLGAWLEQVRDISRVDLSAIQRRAQITHDVAANWKAVVENFIECYHCPLVHSTTLPQYGGDDYTVELRDGCVTQQLESDRFTFAYVFPNTQLSVYGNSGAVVVRSIDPVDVRRTTTRLDYWFSPEVDEKGEREWIDFFETVVGEDEPMCESVQRGLDSGALDLGFLHPGREDGLAHFHDQVRGRLGQQLLT